MLFVLHLADIGEILKSKSITVDELNFSSFHNVIVSFLKLKNIVKTLRPDVIQSWLYHADFISIFIKIIDRSIPIFWNIRGDLSIKKSSRFTIFISCINALFSWVIPNK